ncbi:hypothetical protein D3C80_1032300 [compost metagenome]|nr:hypothetical protein Q4S33_08665 [Acinetobacter calcoaceticus]
MSSLYFITLIILLVSLLIWLLLVNDLYLKYVIYSYKSKIENSQNNDSLIINFLNDEKNPLYIREILERSLDNYQLLKLYLASNNMIDYTLFNSFFVEGNQTPVNYLYIDKVGIFKPKTIRSSINNLFFGSLRFLSFLVFCIISGAFAARLLFNDFDVNDNGLLGQFCLSLFVAILFLMPNNFFHKNLFYNKLYSFTVYWACVLFAVIFSVYIYQYNGLVLMNKIYIILTISFLIIFIGSYSYISYLKMNYLMVFFELLKSNLAHSEKINTRQKAR